MIVWVDAQLPPKLAGWLTSRFGMAAVALREIGLRDADDRAIFSAAKSAADILISKDQDFTELVTRLGPPPRLIWLTCGNVSNSRRIEIFEASFEAALAVLQSGEPIVEIGDRT